jgi:hypothetical protein
MKIIQFIVAGAVAIGSPGAFAAPENQPKPLLGAEPGKAGEAKAAPQAPGNSGAPLKDALVTRKSTARMSKKKKELDLGMCDK